MHAYYFYSSYNRELKTFHLNSDFNWQLFSPPQSSALRATDSMFYALTKSML